MIVLKIIGCLILGCFIVGLIVSAFEKKKGWVDGHKPYGIYEKYFKRPLDFSISLFALIILWPIIAIIALLVRTKLGSPVIFAQERPGLGGEVFKIKKFRTMTEEKDADGVLLPDKQRLTKFGRFLRNSSCDELTEIFNILKGDMSIVGPRPLLVKYLPLYNEEQKHRHDVRPGLTGYAQANGRNEATWTRKFEMDVEYVNKITFLGDLKILLDTFLVVFSHKGVDTNVSSKYTMAEFTGEEGK